MKTLNEMRYLQVYGFGRPYPRHGLHLLHWFSNEYVTFTNNRELLAVWNPDEGGFGCHRFYDNDNLLPYEGLPFYELGNLGAEGADDLPEDVTEHHTGLDDNSNIDRIIFSLKSGKELIKIYVTKHDHHSGSFDPQHTYRISKGLITIIGNLELDDFLEQAGYFIPCPSPMDTLNEMIHLQGSGFGRPCPRHGLHLLHWFSDKYVKFNNNEMFIERNPKKKAFGVQRFHDDNNLLPDREFYEVGNLGAKGAENLPGVVTEHHTGLEDDSNIDRIIFSLKPDKVLDKIYITKHNHHRGSFDPEHTYGISKGMVTIIGNLELDEFLEQAGYS